MSNSPKGGRRPKSYDDFAYDKLGPKVRKALQEAVISWDADWCLKQVRERGADYVVRKIREGDKQRASKGFQMKPGQKAVPSSYTAARVSILRANW